ncbi:uncharacterized protein UMAG_05830 [Mycosarcoma maydis]|uniref:SURP motif domain-containing protein n=1 Tax=Mycosarcoma maydis TaxID=5270 RepID=A0A0D1DNU8_MYCMD|nr:uncharacterized protein UMAG_05830 [Ustilago maydis 521]KIS66089.1 hypothetical protein UMAG_05830 [Ustilago maydis 521]|eukprot:XP_011392196.1 hypothetical protein UMAG_05830 [Ustilago maydis 521]
MIRPPFKKQRLRRRSSSGPQLDDIFTSSSAAHIFAAASTSQSSLASAVLQPTSYEITLNDDQDLKQSLRATSKDSLVRAPRLVTWTSSCGKHSIITDRYDAVHLLSQLPQKPPNTHTETDEIDIGWSDLESDTEDLFFMTDAEAADFQHNKARAALEAQRLTRLEELGPSSPSPSTASHTTVKDDEKVEELSKVQFELMQKTARVVTSSSNASLLEMKILANHGGDGRFDFLRKEWNQRWGGIWEVLKASKGEMGYDAALRIPNGKTNTPPALQPGLVAYDDSDGEAQESDQAETNESNQKAEQTSVKRAETATLKKQKQTERLARAKKWLESRSAKPASPSPTRSTSS